MRTLEILSKKLKFVEADPVVKISKALKDAQPELEKLRQKAISKVFFFPIIVSFHTHLVGLDSITLNTHFRELEYQLGYKSVFQRFLPEFTT